MKEKLVLSAAVSMTRYKHRLVFLGAWILILVALLVYPGFEIKSLVWGLIIGCWPFALWPFVLSKGSWDTIILFSMLVLSGLEVGVCAWLMDKSRLSKLIWIALLVAIPAGAVWRYHASADDFSWWRHSLVSVSMPEGYELTISDFNRLYLIPKTIVGGMWGLYFVTALGAVWAVFGTIIRHCGPVSGVRLRKLIPDSGSDPDRS